MHPSSSFTSQQTQVWPLVRARLGPWTLALLLALSAVLPRVQPVAAAPGDLDLTFGGRGFVTPPLRGANEARAVVRQADGKLVAAGYGYLGSTREDFVLVRYNTDGTLDSSFGGDGIVTTHIGTQGSNNDLANALAVQADGKLVAAGSAFMGSSTGNVVALVRYNTDGTLDSSFGGDGIVTTPVSAGSSSDFASALAVQADGKLVAAGGADMGSTGSDVALVRYNADGTLDSSFGGDGIVTTPISPNGTDFASTLAVQVDGKLVAAGGADMGSSTGRDFALVRYNSDGTLDSSFGGDGIVTTPVAAGSSSDSASALAVQVDGKLVAAGSAVMGSTGRDFALVRYNADGTLDSSFGGDGIVTTPIGAPGGSGDAAEALAVQADGKLVAAGYANMGSPGQDFALVRYNVDGSLDSSFGGDGIVTTPVTAGSSSDSANALAVQADGKLVATGSAFMGSTGKEVALVRYNTDGTLDSSFGSGGIVTTPVSTGPGEARAVVRQADGKLVATGYVYSQPGSAVTDFVLVRYNSDGTLDSSFGGDGIVTTLVGFGNSDFAYALVVQADGKLVAAGSAGMGSTGRDFALVRYHSDGTLDSSFGGDGIVTTPVGPSINGDFAHALAVQADGKLVAAGSAFMGSSTGNDVALVRYNTDGSLDSSFGGDGIVTTPVGTADFTDIVYALAVQGDGKLVAAGVADMGSSTGEDIVLVRYNSDGTLDSSFGGDAIVTTSVAAGSGDFAYALVVQADGKLVAAGGANMGSPEQDFALVRYTSDGTLDSSFGGDGIVTTPVTAGSNSDFARALAVQVDGKLVAAGGADMGSTGSDFALVRYKSDGTLDSSFGGDGIVTTAVGPGDGPDNIYGLAIEPDGKVVSVGMIGGVFGLARFEGGPLNSAPTAEDDMLDLDEDSTGTAEVLANDSDPDGNLDPATLSITSAPSHGTTTVDADHVIVYAPEANYSGVDQLTYEICDTEGLCDSADVAITVTPVDDAPVAVDDTATVAEDAGATAIDVLGNDTDVDGGQKLVAAVTQPDGGTVAITGGGTGLSYTPDANLCTASGTTDDFTYTLAPGGSTATVAVTVTCVNDAPVLGDIVADQVVAIGVPAKVYVTFSDPDAADTHTAVWDWGDGTSSSGTVTEASGAGSVGTQAAPDSHVYTLPGVYVVGVTIDDGQGGTDSARFEYVVVYDADGGFVTGGGWIESPAAACPDGCGGASGKANFGFVAKYQKGADTPAGQTQFQFRAGDLDFDSTSYEWLVVAGARAKYKGEGTINGAGSYGFMLTATDGQANGGGGTDLFRIKIWDQNNGDAVVYDNQMGKGDDAYDGTALGGGSIVVDTGKQAKAAGLDEPATTGMQLFLPLLNQ